MTARAYAPGSMAVLALLSACAVGPDYRAPSPASLNVPTNYAADGATAQRADLSAWWSSFDDPILSQLIEWALRDNLDIAQGVARLRQRTEEHPPDLQSLMRISYADFCSTKQNSYATRCFTKKHTTRK